MQAPDGVVTFLFTDIEGSSRLWEQDPERMPPRWRGTTPWCAPRSQSQSRHAS